MALATSDAVHSRRHLPQSRAAPGETPAANAPRETPGVTALVATPAPRALRCCTAPRPHGARHDGCARDAEVADHAPGHPRIRLNLQSRAKAVRASCPIRYLQRPGGGWSGPTVPSRCANCRPQRSPDGWTPGLGGCLRANMATLQQRHWPPRGCCQALGTMDQ